jgi:hypothetical protein
MNGKIMHQCVKVWFENGKGRAAPKTFTRKTYENALYETIYDTIKDAART